MEEGIIKFLKETKFCDFSNPEIQKLTKEIAKNCKNEQEFAIRAFYWVRDNILYRVGMWQRKASETLAEKEGTCTNKSNLLVALLRANNIPAGYGVMKVYGQRYFGPIAIPMLKEFVSDVSVHVYAIVYLNDKWIKCDSSSDKEFSDNTSYFNFTTNLVNWDGREDSLMVFKKNDVVEENFPVSDIDSWMLKKSKNARGLPLKIANIYIKFARDNKQKVADVQEFENLFKKYLKANYFFDFCLLRLILFWKGIKPKFF